MRYSQQCAMLRIKCLAYGNISQALSNQEIGAEELCQFPSVHPLFHEEKKLGAMINRIYIPHTRIFLMLFTTNRESSRKFV